MALLYFNKYQQAVVIKQMKTQSECDAVLYQTEARILASNSRENYLFGDAARRVMQIQSAHYYMLSRFMLGIEKLNMRAKITQNPNASVSYSVPNNQEGTIKTFILYSEDVSTGKVLKYSERHTKDGRVIKQHGYFFDHRGNSPIYKWDMTLIQMARAFRERETDYLRTLKNA